MSDAVNKPAHYNQGSIECIEAMKIVLTPEEFRGYLKGNVFKYLWREKDKNGIEDLKKAKWYLDRLVDSLDEYEQQKASDLQSLKDHPFGKLKTAPLNSDKIPEGYRKLNDSSEEPRQIGDLRWSVSEKRYVEISVGEIGYANRNNWAACRKVEPAIKQSLTTEPPDGWRFLERGETVRNGDMLFRNGIPLAIVLDMIGSSCYKDWMPIIRRNRFEVGEKVVRISNGGVYKVIRILSMGYQLESEFCAEVILHGKDLAPYIEDAK